MNYSTDPRYDVWRSWIKTQRSRKKTWEEIDVAVRGSDDALHTWITGQVEAEDWHSLGSNREERLTTWRAIVAAKKRWEADSRPLRPTVLGLYGCGSFAARGGVVRGALRACDAG